MDTSNSSMARSITDSYNDYAECNDSMITQEKGRCSLSESDVVVRDVVIRDSLDVLMFQDDLGVMWKTTAKVDWHHGP